MFKENIKSKYKLIIAKGLNPYTGNDIFYHGSNKKIDQFKTDIPSKRYLLFHAFDVKSQGVFLAFTPDTAQSYGKTVYEVKLDKPNLFISIEDEHAGIDRLPLKKEEELAEMLIASSIEGKLNLLETTIYIPEDFNPEVKDKNNLSKNWDWIYEAVQNGGILWDVLDDSKFVNKMKELGYDGTMVEEKSQEEGRSLFICNLNKIKILGIWNKTDKEYRSIYEIS